jgi:hypothetical protein
VYASTFDDPNWFDIKPESSKHIFIDVAGHETIQPPGFSCFAERAIRNDGTPLEAVEFEQPQVVGSLSGQSGG